MDNRHLSIVYGISRRIVEDCLPDEMVYYDELWDALEPFLREPAADLLTLPDRERTTVFLGPHRLHLRSLPSFSVIQCVASGVDYFLVRGQLPKAGEFKAFVKETLRQNHDLGEEQLSSLSEAAERLLAADLSCAYLPEVQKRGREAVERVSKGKPERLKGVRDAQRRAGKIPVWPGERTTISVDVHGGQPCVVINGSEDRTFRWRERLFCVLLRLAAARKKGDGLLHRIDDLHEPDARSHTYYDVKDRLEAVTGVQDVMCAAEGGKGKVRLDLPSEAITIGKSICGFRSCYVDRVQRSVEMCPGSASDRQKFFERHKKRLLSDALALVRNSLLLAEAVRDMGWRLKEETCLTVLESFLSVIPDEKSLVDDFFPVLDLTGDLRDILE